MATVNLTNVPTATLTELLALHLDLASKGVTGAADIASAIAAELAVRS